MSHTRVGADGETLTPETLRRARRLAGLTQAELATRLGVHSNTLARWERGEQRIGNPALVRLALEYIGPSAHRFSDSHTSESEPPRPFAFPGVGAASRAWPVPLTSFVGREHEVEAVRALLGTTRLLVLAGPGGVGKTRLAQAVVDGLDGPMDYVAVIQLAPLAEPSLVPQVVAKAAGITEQPGVACQETIAESIGTRRVLVVLDNCEHLAGACADLTSYLLQGCPALRVLATSREPLGVDGETMWRVPPLTLPSRETWTRCDQVVRTEAVRLFIERAVTVQPSFALSVQNATAVAEVCSRLDGMPLAIELAAARVRVLTPQQILGRLDDGFRLLVGGSRGVPSRQQTLRATIAWSYGLLSGPERLLFNRLSAFAGGWTLEAAEAVCGFSGIDSSAVLDLLTHLVDRSLAIAEEQNGAMRYRLLETLRQYGLERLQEEGERSEVQSRHARFFVELALGIAPKLYPGGAGDRDQWLRILTDELDNLRTVLDHCIRRGDHLRGLRLARGLTQFWLSTGRASEGRTWLEQMLDASTHHATAEHLGGAIAAAQLAAAQGDYSAVRRLLEPALSIGSVSPDPWALVTRLTLLGTANESLGDPSSATRYLDDALRLARQQGDPQTVVDALEHRGLLAHRMGDLLRARAMFEEAVDVARAHLSSGAVGRPLSALGHVLMDAGDLVSARNAFQARLAIWQQLGNTRNIAISRASLGMLSLREGNLADARRQLSEALEIAHRTSDRDALGYLLACSAELAVASGRLEDAAILGGAAEVFRETVGSVTMPATQAWIERTLGQLRLVGPAEAWLRGRSVPCEQALALAKQGDAPRDGLRAPGTSLLSPREQEVAHLVSDGLTNRAIAKHLIVSERTVDTHLEHIRAKLNLRSRAQIARWITISASATQKSPPVPSSLR